MLLLALVACRRETVDDPVTPPTTTPIAQPSDPTADTAQPDPCARPTVVRERPHGSSFLACVLDRDCPDGEVCLPVDPADDLYDTPAQCLTPCDDGCTKDEVCHTVYDPGDTGWAFTYWSQDGCYCADGATCPVWTADTVPEFGGLQRWTEAPSSWPPDARSTTAGAGWIWAIAGTGPFVLLVADEARSSWRSAGTLPDSADETRPPQIAWIAGRLFLAQPTALWSGATDPATGEVQSWEREERPFTELRNVVADPVSSTLVVGRDFVGFGNGDANWAATTVGEGVLLENWRTVGGRYEDDLENVGAARDGVFYASGAGTLLYAVDLASGEVVAAAEGYTMGGVRAVACDRFVVADNRVAYTWDTALTSGRSSATPILSSTGDAPFLFVLVGDELVAVGSRHEWTTRRVTD